MNSALRLCLLPLTLAFGALICLRRSLYRRGLLKRRSVSTPTVSVGSHHAGGTGKTPIAHYLLKSIGDNGFKSALLSRGYGRRTRGVKGVISGATADPTLVGDEPAMLVEMLPSLDLVVAEDRYEGAQWIEAERAPQVIVLDDGFSHLAFEADLEFVVIPADPLDWFESFLLPTGTLREPWGAQSLASDWMCWFHARCGLADPAHFAPAVRALWDQLPGHQRILTGTRTVIAESWGEPRPKDQGLWLSAGIARPEGFELGTQNAGFSVVGKTWFPDHHVWTVADLDACLKSASATGATLAVTAKDAVKLRKFKERLVGQTLLVCRPELVWQSGEQVVADALKKLLGGGI